LGDEKGRPRPYRKCLQLLYSLETDPGFRLSSKKFKFATREIEKLRRASIESDRWTQLILEETDYLFRGFKNPKAAAVALERLSYSSKFESPTLAQTCLVHAINIYTHLGDKKMASGLFKTGKAVFYEGNPTSYNRTFWHPAKVLIVHVNPGQGPFSRMEYPQAHEKWKI